MKWIVKCHYYHLHYYFLGAASECVKFGIKSDLDPLR